MSFSGIDGTIQIEPWFYFGGSAVGSESRVSLVYVYITRRVTEVESKSPIRLQCGAGPDDPPLSARWFISRWETFSFNVTQPRIDPILHIHQWDPYALSASFMPCCMYVHTHTTVVIHHRYKQYGVFRFMSVIHH